MTICSLTCGCEQLQLSDPLLERLHTNPKSTLDRQKNLFHLKKVIFDPISSKVAAVPVQNLLYGNLRQRQLV